MQGGIATKRHGVRRKDPGAFHGKISLGVIFEITEIIYKSIFKA